jgi:transposase InsO family protein
VLTAELEEAETAATRAGAAVRQAGIDAKEGGDQAATGWRAVTQGLSQYADQAMDWGKGLSDTLVGAFRSAEGAIFQYINGFYNPRRRHSSLGGKSPLAFERKVA